jgi:protein-S-isoprenylcysteine O-methyltransferase Ste14
MLARARVPLGFVFAVAVLWLAQPTRASLGWGVVIAAIGEGLRIWAAGHLTKSREVTMSGPYRWMAHPLYVGSSLMGAGLAVASHRVSVAVLIAIYLGATITAAVRSEEAFLRERFGDGYDGYRRGDPAPRRRRFSVPSRWRTANRAAAGLLLAVLLLALKATYNGVFWRAGAGR